MKPGGAIAAGNPYRTMTPDRLFRIGRIEGFIDALGDINRNGIEHDYQIVGADKLLHARMIDGMEIPYWLACNWELGGPIYMVEGLAFPCDQGWLSQDHPENAAYRRLYSRFLTHPPVRLPRGYGNDRDPKVLALRKGIETFPRLEHWMDDMRARA